MHSVADIFYLVLAILFAVLMLRAAFGLLPRARPRVWGFCVTGYENVRISRFGLVSVIFCWFGAAVAFGSAAFTLAALGLIGLLVSIVGFILASIAKWRDVRLFRLQRLAALTSI